MNRIAIPRLLGVATIAYSLAVAARPEVLLKPTGLAAVGRGTDELRGRPERAKTLAVTGGFGALCAASALATI